MAKATGRKKSKLTTALTSGPKATHGGYSYFTAGKIPEHRKYIEQYLTAVREGMIRDIGPEEKDLTTAQIILIDRLVSLLGVIRLIEEKVKEDGIFRGRELTPSLKQNYVSYNNTVRLTLERLGIDKSMGDRVLTPFEIAAEFDKKKEKEAKAKAKAKK